jgi:hypothetical protein
VQLLWSAPQLQKDVRVLHVRPPHPEEGARPEKPKRPPAWEKFNKMLSFNPLAEPSIKADIW